MNLAKKRLIVFGGTGLIGSEVALQMTRLEYHVVVLGRKIPVHCPFEFHSINFEDAATWRDFIEPEDHIAFMIPMHIPRNTLEVTVEKEHFEMVKKLFDECSIKKIAHMLLLSSGGAIYGTGKVKPFLESDTPHPTSEYGKFKLKLEKLLEAYITKKSFPACIARPSNAYGENQALEKLQGAITVFYHQISNDLPLNVYGDLLIRKDYIHVEDLACGLVKIILDKVEGIYNLGFEKTYTLQEIIALIEKEVGKKATIIFHPFSSSDIHNYSLDCSKAKKELGFHPIIDLPEGIARYHRKLTK